MRGKSNNSNNNSSGGEAKTAGGSHLPFEVSARQPGQGSQGGARRKRIEAFIASEKLDAVLDAVGSLKLAATYYDSRGKGKGEKYTISYGRGIGSAKMAYSERKTVVTIVDENRVEDVVSAIRASAGSGAAGSAGIIVISPVDDMLPI